MFPASSKSTGEFHPWKFDKSRKSYVGAIYLNASAEDISSLNKNIGTNSIISNWVNTIVHEITHAHQYIKINPLERDRTQASHFRTILAKKQKKSNTSHYILRHNELDAFAQQAVIEVISRSGVKSLKSMLVMIQNDMLMFSGRPTIPSPSVYDVREHLDDLKGEVPDDQIQAAWKYFMKKLAKKASWYLEQSNQTG